MIVGRTPLSTVGDRAFPVATASSLVSGTFYPSMSLLQLFCLSSGHASRLISSPFPIPVPDHVQCPPVPLVILDTLIVHVTYLLTLTKAASTTHDTWQTGIEEHDDTQAAEFKPVDTHRTHLEHEIGQNAIVNLTQSEVIGCRSLTKAQACGQCKAIV